jgi:hypothetical protein
MNRNTRRDFLADVGRGMLVASVGSAVASDLGLASVMADAETKRLTFGHLEPLASLLQQTPSSKLLPVVMDRMKQGADLRTLVAAAGLANARTFGGQDYTGYHAFMALAPAYAMAQELPEQRQALPVLKVLYRNTERMQQKGGRANEVLRPVPPAAVSETRNGDGVLQAATRKADFDHAEQVFAALAREPVGEAYNHLQYAVQDEIDVHRVVLAWRAWAMLDLTGKEHAHTLLRQSVRYCVEAERDSRRRTSKRDVRSVLPKLLDEHKLLGRAIGQRRADDAWIDELSRSILANSPEESAGAVAAALAEGFSPEDVGEAISLAATQLLLLDPGRTKGDADKPAGSVHGASVGVHASDSANAWRNIARVSNPRNTYASLIVGAFHTSAESVFRNRQPYPLDEHRAAVTSKDPASLLRDTEGAIKDKNQAHACALIHRYGELGLPARPVFDLLLTYAVSEDGALHAEKYYRTVVEEFATTRPAFRWRHLIGLARVTASEYGFPAPGYTEACNLLKVS